ncbi:bifunctional diguanylate cyclase/phosphodiesterase [uncultured Cellulomonas sp.]|uniref:putative bifunctional diguanylate cyclase/phosphodiesterase n=1 Tax=uncultured Cellulomonas sp. TaxID=189682 RepID=UPI002603887C|nr:EAL domain-containing protein [uncultured Cellulomonas sp.]
MHGGPAGAAPGVPPDEDGLRRRVRRDVVVVVAALVLLAALGVALEAFDTVAGWDARVPAAHLGDVVVFVALAHVVMMVFGARRGRDLRRADVERAQRTDQLAFLAHHDPLTRLLNRTGFAGRADAAFDAAQRDGRVLAVLVLDLDRFKEVNGTLGHHVGDELLTRVAERLVEQLPARATVARLGGDEFAVLLDPARNAADAHAVARDVVTAFTTPLVVAGMVLDVGLSVGVACAAGAGDSWLLLLRRADAAMYRAKAHHTGVEAYDAAHDDRVPERVTLYGELRRAVDRAELVVHYQPQVDLRRGTVRGVEALVRWEHPTRGTVPPSEFLGLAEQTGLIRGLTSVVLAQALDDVAAWRADGLALSVAVNLSVESLRDAALPDVVAALLADRRLDPAVLEVEITESVEIARAGDPAVDRADVLTRLRALGIRVAIDDYGTGYSSLSYLSRLPVDVLKIDQSFVREIELDPSAQVIVRSTVELAQSLRLQVVAEGVETEQAWRLLRAYGCDTAQGYWFARPGPAADVPATVHGLHRRLAQPAA